MYLTAALTSTCHKLHLLFEPLFTHLQNGRIEQNDFYAQRMQPAGTNKSGQNTIEFMKNNVSVDRYAVASVSAF